MTLNELVNHLADELNLSSPEAKMRIERTINVRYRQITSSVGLSLTRREEVSKVATIGSRFITFTGVEKLETVFRKVGTRNIIIDQISVEEMTDVSPRDEPPQNYAVYSTTPTTVTLWLDCTPITEFTLYAVSLADVSTLSGTVSPALPESFHDILISAVCADEYRRKEKKELAQAAEQTFQNRLSDLRLFLAKSAWLEMYNGKLRRAEGWWDTSGAPYSGYTRL